MKLFNFLVPGVAAHSKYSSLSHVLILVLPAYGDIETAGLRLRII
jgi:hypothetical protein